MAIIRIPVGYPVIVNTGGNDIKGCISDSYEEVIQGKLVEQPRNPYWQGNYLVRFENGTQQYIPEANVRRAET